MRQIEAIEPRLLCATVVPGPLSLAAPDPGQSARIGHNPLSGGPFLGWTKPRQRVSYTIDAPQTDAYAFTFQAATGSKIAAVHFEVDGTNLTGTLKIPNTHTWYNWQTVSLPAPLELLAGLHTLTLVIQSGTANFQGASFSEVPIAVSDPPPTPLPTGPPMPGTQGANTPTPPIAGNWSLTFADEFNGTSLGGVWTPHQYWNNGPTAGEGLEESDPANVAVSNGALHLTARVDNSFGPAYTGGLVQTGGIAADATVPKFSFLYGYAEARIEVPAGAGLWPAFWMLPASHHDNNGEIDVVEMYDADPTTVDGTVHRFGAQQQHADSTGTDLSGNWHTFAVDWEPDHITWYLDGAAYATTTNKSLIPTEAMFPIFDLAVGGHNNAPTASTPFPAVMNVDYIRIWQQH
jgi:hypothetical protein